MQQVNDIIQQMSLDSFRVEIADFAQRIKDAFYLEEDVQHIIPHRKKIMSWIQQQSARLKQEKDKSQNQSFFTGLFKTNKTKQQALQNQLQIVKQVMRMDIINFDDIAIATLDLPSEVSASLMHLKSKANFNFYGVFSCPLMQSMLLKKKQNMDNCLKIGIVNQIKIRSFGSERIDVLKYQRNTIEQLCNRLFNHESELSTVVKIQIQNKNLDKTIDIYCYAEDLKRKKNLECNELTSLKEDCINKTLYLETAERKYIINDLSIFNAFMTQMMVVPFQTIVSDYIVFHDHKQAKLLKSHKNLEQSEFSAYLRDHPSLRNPLFFFNSYIRKHEFTNKSLRQSLSVRSMNANFYQILNILVDMMRNDFSTKIEGVKTSSLCFDKAIFRNIWNLFHEVAMLPNWIQEIINPIKSSVTLSEIINKLHPILNELLKVQRGSYSQFREALLNIPIENYLTINVSKLNIQRYKHMFINIASIQQPPLSIKFEIYKQVFQQVIQNYDLTNVSVYESLYFLNFVANNSLILYEDKQQSIHPSWKLESIWSQIIELRNRQFQQLPYVNLNLDILAFSFNFDPVIGADFPFQSIQNNRQQVEVIKHIDWLIVCLKQSFESKYESYLSILMQKSFKFKRYAVVKYLMEKGIEIRNYKEIFTHNEEGKTHRSKLLRINQKNNLINFMKNRLPESFRHYQWEELINVRLKGKVQDQIVAVLPTIQEDKFYINKDIYCHLTSRTIMNNTISRKDYMFATNRLIAKVTIQDVQAYIEVTVFPLLRYFYFFFLQQLAKSSLLLNFCGFFAEKGSLVHLLQCIPDCFNFQKGLASHSQIQLKNFTNVDDISEAIIISMMLMPTNVLLKNIIVSPLKYEGKEKLELKSLFIVDFNDFYQKNGFQGNSGTNILKVSNSLFLFDQMRNSISERLMKKYSNINVFQIINAVFKKCSSLIREVNRLRPKDIEWMDNEAQLFSLIFQNGFIQSLAERMFKIKCTFQKNLNSKTHLSHLDLLEVLNPSLSYHYNEIIQSSHRLIERERILLDPPYKKSFIISTTLVNLLSKSSQVEEANDSFPGHYMSLNFQGPTENLSNLYHHIQRYDVYLKKISDFHNYNHEVIEYFIRNIDLSTYQKDQRENLLLNMQEYSKEYMIREKNSLPLSVIRINHNDTFKEKNMQFSHERLKQLIFQEVRCSEGDLNNVLKKYQSISKLVLRSVRGVSKIGDYMFGISTLQIKNLKQLTIIGCDLQIIDLCCQQLEHLSLRNNNNLTHIYVNSKRLKEMDCSLCPKLHLQNIGIYIFRMINVLLCTNSCDGDVHKLENANYGVFLSRILRYLLNRFQESHQYKLQLIITLIKLQLIDQKYFKLGNLKISNNLLGLVAKTGLEILSIVEQHIFQLFLINKQVDLLSIEELMRINISSLRIISQYLQKTSQRKEFSSIRFTEFLKIPQFYQDHLAIILDIFKNIHVQKTFTLYLTLIKLIESSFYVSLVQLITIKMGLQKLDLIISNSEVTETFLQQIFSQEGKTKIHKFEFADCQVRIKDQIKIDGKLAIKHVVFKNCKIYSLEMLQTFDSLTYLEINSCKIEVDARSVYETIGKLTNLVELYLINIKQGFHDKNIRIPDLFQNLLFIPGLKYFDFSSNLMTFQELQLFSKKISNLKICQLTLQNFYKDSPLIDKSPIPSFLSSSFLKIINIQFRTTNTHLIESFITQLSHNTSVIKLDIKTDLEIPSSLFENLQNNSQIESIISNHPIPNWLNNHINDNKEKRPCSIQCQNFEQFISYGRQVQDFCRIGLSLDGGGVRGLLLATELDYLARNVKQPLHKIFDCIGGTSIGGILALASSGSIDGLHPVCSTSDLMAIFEQHGNKIFKKSQMKQLKNLFQTKYEVSSFQQLLQYYFKDVRMSDTLSSTNVLVTAVNRLNNEDVIFRSLNSIFDSNEDFYMRDIARATSAAPTYFPSAQIKNVNATRKYSLVDGGVGLNNPSKRVIDDVIKITQNQNNRKNYFLLSLGTGRPKNIAIPQNAGIKDLQPVIDAFTEAANYYTEKDLAQNYKGHYLRVSPDIEMNRKDAELDNTRPEILKVYKQTGLSAAEEYFSHTIAFGKFKNQSLIQWLQENTARKYDM